MVSGGKSHRDLKICCGVTILRFIIVLTVLVALSLTILKPKQPQVTPLPVTLEKFELVPSLPPILNVTLGIVVTINNRNYGSFKYVDTTAYISYRGNVVAEAPIEHGTIPSRGKHNISTSTEISSDKFLSNPYFLTDVLVGNLNFTSSSTMHGKVRVFEFLKIKATTFTTCDIAVFFHDLAMINTYSSCQSHIDL